MKWFKHQSQSHTDEKLADLLSDCGLEGYGFWWLLMEVVAEQCTDDKCYATYSLPHWSRLLYSHHNRVSKYLGKLEVIGIVTVEYIKSKIRVTIPNLLKYRDEYSRKSGQRPDNVPPKKEKEKEKEIQKEKIEEPKSKPIAETVKKTVQPSIKKSDSEWLEEIKNNPAYQGMNFDVEIGKAQAWCMTKGRKCSRPFLLNWFNRADKQVSINGQTDRPRSFREQVNRAAGDAFERGEY